MNATFKTNRSYFINTNDGNESLPTTEARINDAIHLLKTDEDCIELEDGTKCYNKQQLEKALTSTITPKNSEKKKIIIFLATIAIVAIGSIIAIRRHNFNMAYKEWLREEREMQRNTVSRGDVIESGELYGMTYEEVVSILGEPITVTKRNGVVEYAYYSGYQLVFYNGRYTHWNTGW